MVECLAALGRPLQQLHGAVHGDAFLVAGDQERDGALRRPTVRSEVIERGSERAGDRALHIYRAAAVERAAYDLAGERRVAPFRLVARRNHVGVPGEDEVRARAADTGIEVFHRRRAGLGESDAMDLESRALQHALDQGERAAFGGCYRGAAQEIAGECDRVHGNSGIGVTGYAPSCAARRLFWFLTQPGMRKASTRTQKIVINIPTIVSDRMSCATATPVRPR